MLGDEWYASRRPRSGKPKRAAIVRAETPREATTRVLAQWGFQWAYEERDGALTFVLANSEMPAASGVHVAADGRVTVAESLVYDVDAFLDDETEWPALLGLVDPRYPEGDWSRWRPGRRVSNPSDPAWYATLWGLGLAGRVSGGRDVSGGPRSALAEAVAMAGGARVRAAILHMLPDDLHGLPYPVLGIGGLLTGLDLDMSVKREDGLTPAIVGARRLVAFSDAPFFVPTIVGHPHLMRAIDGIGGVPVAGLRRPALWGVGCATVRKEPVWQVDRMIAIGRLPYPLGAASDMGVVVATAAAIPHAFLPSDETEFRAFEVLASALDDMPSFRSEFYTGSSGRQHDVATMLSPAKGNWTRYLAKLFAAEGGETGEHDWRKDLVSSTPANQVVVRRRLARLLRRSQDVGEAFAREVLVPFVVAENEVMATSVEAVNAWRSLGASALFRDMDLVRMVSTWRRWAAGRPAKDLGARLAGLTWPIPFKVLEIGDDTSVVPLGSAEELVEREPFSGALNGTHPVLSAFDCAAGRTVMLEVVKGDRRSSLAAARVSFPDGHNEGRPVVDLLWHEAYGPSEPDAADMETIRFATSAVAAFDWGTEETWREWVRHRREREGSYAWLIPTADYRFDDEALRGVALEWWRSFLPKSARKADVATILGHFEPEVVATMRHLRAAGVLMFPYWQRSIKTNLK